MKNSFALSLLSALFLAFCIGTGVSMTAEMIEPGISLNPMIPAAIYLATTAIPKPKNVLGAVTVEIWTDYIISELWKENEFLKRAFNDDQYVLSGSVVHIPQSGGRPTIVKNRSSFPATAVKRADTDLTYALDVYTSDPTHIPNAELMEISYDKIDSVLGEHMASLKETIGDEMLYKWAATAAGAILRTTGAAVGSHTGSATGNRKIFVKEDLKAMQTKFNKDNVPKKDRVALFDSELLSQLQDDEDLKKRDRSMELDMKNGVITRLYGFDIMDGAIEMCKLQLEY